MPAKTVEHPALGRLTYDEGLEQWETQVALLPGCPVDFSLSAWTGADPKIEVEEILRRGVDFFEWARHSERLVRQKIADDLLDCYMENWSEEEGGMGPMSREEFLERIAPDALVLNTDGRAYWYYSDGGLFAGHVIEVRIREDRTVSEVCLAG